MRLSVKVCVYPKFPILPFYASSRNYLAVAGSRTCSKPAATSATRIRFCENRRPRLSAGQEPPPEAYAPAA
jgi:hypothetical protein